MRHYFEQFWAMVFRLLTKLLVWQRGNWQESWSAAWHEPQLGLRLIGLCVGLGITYYTTQIAFGELGLLGGLSYVLAVYMAFSKATPFRIARVNQNDVPLGIIAPIFILLGVIGSREIQSLLWDARDAAVAQDFTSAVVILGAYGAFYLFFRRWQSGNPY